MKEDTIDTNGGMVMSRRAGFFFIMIIKRHFSYNTSCDVHTNLVDYLVDYGQLPSAMK
jgi:hypothetical protein